MQRGRSLAVEDDVIYVLLLRRLCSLCSVDEFLTFAAFNLLRIQIAIW